MNRKTQLIIKQRSPLKTWSMYIGYTVLMVIAGYGLYFLGEYRSSFNNAELKEDIVRLEEEMATLEQENARLRGEVALNARSNQVEKQAYEEVDATLKSLQQEILELKKEAAFYRGIVSPKESAKGVNIQTLELARTEKDDVYNFKLVLTQVIKNGRLVKGSASVVVEGVQDGQAKQIPLQQLSGGSINKMSLRFKYFQTFEGTVILPKGFLPSRVQVAVNPTSKGHVQVKKTFDWLDLIS